MIDRTTKSWIYHCSCDGLLYYSCKLSAVTTQGKSCNIIFQGTLVFSGLCRHILEIIVEAHQAMPAYIKNIYVKLSNYYGKKINYKIIYDLWSFYYNYYKYFIGKILFNFEVFFIIPFLLPTHYFSNDFNSLFKCAN